MSTIVLMISREYIRILKDCGIFHIISLEAELDIELISFSLEAKFVRPIFHLINKM